MVNSAREGAAALPWGALGADRAGVLPFAPRGKTCMTGREIGPQAPERQHTGACLSPGF